jgi:hypothetical protein
MYIVVGREYQRGTRCDNDKLIKTPFCAVAIPFAEQITAREFSAPILGKSQNLFFIHVCVHPRSDYPRQRSCFGYAVLNGPLSHTGGSRHALQPLGELRVLLLNLKLCAGGLGVRKSVDDLGLGARELGSLLKVLKGLRDLALLEEELSHGGNGNVAFGVNCEN